MRPEAEVLAEGRQKIDEIRSRGVFIAEGHGKNVWDLEPKLDERIRYLYRDSKKSIWAELPGDFPARPRTAVPVVTQSKDRNDYILHPPTGERLEASSASAVRGLAAKHGDAYDVQLVISDGLNAFSLTDEDHLAPYLDKLRAELAAAGYRIAPECLVVRSGRVRASNSW